MQNVGGSSIKPSSRNWKAANTVGVGLKAA